MTAEDLQKRLKEFAYRIVPLCQSLPHKKISQVIENQILKSSFSSAANYRAACKAQSKPAFKAKLSIAFEEIDETLFWLEVIRDLNLIREKKMSLILKEADELTRILAATRIKLERRLKER